MKLKAFLGGIQRSGIKEEANGRGTAAELSAAPT